MAKASPKVKATTPKSVFAKPLEADFRGLFKALSKGVGHTTIGKWEELSTDTVEALSALGLSTEPEELAHLLVRRGVAKALFELVGESAGQLSIDPKKNSEALIKELDLSLAGKDIYLDRKFLDRPEALPLVDEIKRMLTGWLNGLGVEQAISTAIVNRFATYFVYSLNQEWRQNGKSYRPLIDALATPFTKAGDREWAWNTYAAFLNRKINEGVFNEAFSLRQIYVPLNAYYLDEVSSSGRSEDISRKKRIRVVVDLHSELEQWAQSANGQSAIRVISGGPGSGKSSFARIFAAGMSSKGNLRLLFVPLHLIDPSKDLVDEVGRFVADEGILTENPLSSDSPEANLVIILDGLDELASQGKASAETARAFVREVERTVERKNQNRVILRVLISGRELAVQENESEFRRPRQVLTLLPYFNAKSTPQDSYLLGDKEEPYRDPGGLLKIDLRNQWWKNYGTLTGKGFKGLPSDLGRSDLVDVTSQPLLNYLVALSFRRDTLDFTKDINLNTIYADLVTAVHERGYEKHRPYGPIRHMKVEDFSRVLEEIGLAAWHGDGRTTTVNEIEHHCRASGLGTLLDVFKEGAKTGVTRLLAAFFFRQYGERSSGDPTFVFTHKSFGEYLTARRIVRAIERVNRELETREKNPDSGWDERDALKHWAQICGPSAMTLYLHVFLLNEMRLRPKPDLERWQGKLTALLNYVLQYGMNMESQQSTTFRSALFQSRNAEEALLVALNACARVTSKVSKIEQPDLAAFGAWFKRIQGQRTGPDSVLAAHCLSFLDFGKAIMHIGDFYNTDFSNSNLTRVNAAFACFVRGQFQGANLQGGIFSNSNLSNSSFHHARLKNVHFVQARLEGCRFVKADLERAHLENSVLVSAEFAGARLENAILVEANLRGANLEGANLKGARMRGANLERAKMKGANFEGADLENANLRQADLEGANLDGAKLANAILDGAIMPKDVPKNAS